MSTLESNWGGYARLVEIIEELDAKFPVEEPVTRGPLNGFDSGFVSMERKLQACRLREMGWTMSGLAQLYGVSVAAVENWFYRDPQVPIVRPVLIDGRRCINSFPQLLCEAVALIQLDLWHEPRPSRPKVTDDTERQRKPRWTGSTTRGGQRLPGKAA